MKSKMLHDKERNTGTNQPDYHEGEQVESNKIPTWIDDAEAALGLLSSACKKLKKLKEKGKCGYLDDAQDFINEAMREAE